MSELTERLRMIGAAPNLLGQHVAACTEAADEIERLTAALARVDTPPPSTHVRGDE